MSSKLLFIALVSLFFGSVMTGTIPTNLENVKAVTNGSIKVEGTNETFVGNLTNGSVKVEATNGSNGTEARAGIEYPTTAPSTVSPNSTSSSEAPTTASPKTSSSEAPTTASPKSTSSSEAPTTASPKSTSSSEAPTTASPKPTTTKPAPTVTTDTSVKAPSSTPAAVVPNRSFDAPNFIGGIILTLGLTAIGFVAYKFYKARKGEGNYRTL